LQAAAKDIMRQYGFEPDFPPAVQQQLAQLRTNPPALTPGGDVRDLRKLLWSSIDNDTSRDLDQVEVAERLPNGDVKVLVGIADLDAFIPKQSAIDQHAAKETTTVYAGVRNFPMLPEELSTGKTSLLENQDRLSVVNEFVVDSGGHVKSSEVYRALVRNQAQLQYNSVGAWLEGTAAAPPKVAASVDLQNQLRLQDEAAQKLKNQRYENGALNLQTVELRPLVLNDQVVDVVNQQKNHATELIEDFMIAANGVVARMLEKVSSLRRIVKQPERWDRIVQLAAIHGEKLPATPDSKALNDFLLKRKTADPDHFAVQDYTHSTAPNRRFPDIVTQRLIKAMLAGQPNPYSDDELSSIAANCTEKENAAKKVEREMSKRLAATAMEKHIGELFDAIVTGVTPHGTFVRVLQPRIEGLLAQGQQGLDVGDRVRVKLIRTDVQRGFIDFARA
jgi:exoribonuclease-2